MQDLNEVIDSNIILNEPVLDPQSNVNANSEVGNFIDPDHTKILDGILDNTMKY